MTNLRNSTCFEVGKDLHRLFTWRGQLNSGAVLFLYYER